MLKTATPVVIKFVCRCFYLFIGFNSHVRVDPLLSPTVRPGGRPNPHRAPPRPALLRCPGVWTPAHACVRECECEYERGCECGCECWCGVVWCECHYNDGNCCPWDRPLVGRRIRSPDQFVPSSPRDCVTYRQWASIVVGSNQGFPIFSLFLFTVFRKFGPPIVCCPPSSVFIKLEA